MEIIKRVGGTSLVVTICTILSLCTYENKAPFSPETSIQADIIWMLNGVPQNPSEVSFVRITATSLCNGAKTTRVFPFSLDSASAASVATGCQFSLLFEGLGTDSQTLYKGEIVNQTAVGPSVSVRITAQACTPVPPDSFKAAPAGKRIRLSWIDRSNNENGFIIKRSLANRDNYQTLDTTTECTYLDTTNLKRRYPYYYLVYSYNDLGLSIKADSINACSLGVNTRPRFISTVSDMDSIAEVGKSYTDTIRFMDSDVGDSVWVSLISSTKGVLIKDSIITWIPDSTQAGQRITVLAIVTDQDLLNRDSLSWSIKVKGIAITSLPPFFSVSKLDLDTSLLLGQLYADTLKASDPEKQPLTYKLLGAPRTAKIDSVTAIIKWQTDSLGRFEVTATVLDTTAKSDTVSWSVIVSKP